MNIKILVCLASLSLVLSSCAMYRQDFDCPPEMGVPCTSVTDLEAMVVDTKKGPDLFLGNDPKGICQGSLEEPPLGSIRFWKCKSKECGHEYLGHYKKEAGISSAGEPNYLKQRTFDIVNEQGDICFHSSIK